MKAASKFVACLAGTGLLVALAVLLSFNAFKQIRDAGESRKRSYLIMTSGTDLFSALKDVETGYRGFLLTRDEAFLQPYLMVHDTIDDSMRELRQLTLSPAAYRHLDAMMPMVKLSMENMARIIELRRHQEAAKPLVDGNLLQNKRLMDAIRIELNRFLQLEETLLARREAVFQEQMRHLLTVIIGTSLFTLLCALLFAYFFYQETQRKLRTRLHLETERLLNLEQNLNAQLHLANRTLQASEEKLSVTLNSIGDAVLTTDAEGRLTGLNPIAEQYTGWTQAESLGRPVAEVFHIINEDTREPSVIPVMDTLALGTIHGLANHTVLIARDGSECAIADSCAPIRDRSGQVVGAIMVFRDVSKEHEVQQALHDSSALIRTVLHTVVDGIITLHADGGLVETVNPAAERMFGYAAEEMLGLSFSVLIPAFDQDQRNGSLEYYTASEEVASGGLGREVVGRRKDGSLFAMELAVSEMWLGGQRHFTGILRDITARKQVEERLQWAQESFRLMVESVVDYAIVMLDPLGRVMTWNSGAARIKGYTAEEVIGEPVARFYAQEAIEAGQPQQDLNRVAAEGRVEDEGWHHRKDGSTFYANVVCTAIRDEAGNLRGFAKLTQDLTERRMVEAQLQNARAVAEKASLAKSEFLSSMSHELRSPLNAILGFAQLMESDLPAPSRSQQESLAQILKAGWHLLALINEILDLAKVESGQIPMSREPVSLAELMDECRGLIGLQAAQRGLTLSFPKAQPPYFVLADRTRVKQVLVNLLTNAIKYNVKDGAVAVAFSEQAPGRTRVSIRDTGPGLPPDQLGQLFQPFNRLGQQGGTEEGTGIGLVVAKRLVELMEGTIGVESALGQGSEFWFELLTVAEPELGPEDTAALGLVPPPLLREDQGRTVLYVEDNPANLKLVEQILLRRKDLRLLTAVDGQAGVELARSARPDVVLMDINLPGISGFEALERLRSDPATARIPVIALSANAMPRDLEKGLRLGFFSYLTKPIKVLEFLEALDVALDFAEKH